MQHGLLTRCIPLMALGWLLVATPTPAQITSTGEDIQASLPRYTVEIILFRYSSGVALGNEVFLPDPLPLEESPPEDEFIPEFGDVSAMRNVPVTENLELDEIILPTVQVELTTTPRDELLLQDVYERLEQLDAYVPLLWTGWSQNAPEQNVSPAIPLRRLGNAPAAFDGTFQLYLSRFLHLVVDLTMTERAVERGAVARIRPDEAATLGASRTQPVRLTINEDRIMKNGDLRYFDHPKFGLLVKVTRVEEIEEPLEESIEETNDATDADPVIPAAQ